MAKQAYMHRRHTGLSLHSCFVGKISTERVTEKNYLGYAIVLLRLGDEEDIKRVLQHLPFP
ncbi:unnamed protein product, partial [Discosporangium mesarthrocarpum]